MAGELHGSAPASVGGGGYCADGMGPGRTRGNQSCITVVEFPAIGLLEQLLPPARASGVRIKSLRNGQPGARPQPLAAWETPDLECFGDPVQNISHLGSAGKGL